MKVVAGMLQEIPKTNKEVTKVTTQFPEKVEILDNGNVTITLDGKNAAISAGGNVQYGHLVLRDRTGNERILLHGYLGIITIRDDNRQPVFDFSTLPARLIIGSRGNGGDIRVRDNSNKVRIHLDGNTGNIFMRDDNGKNVFQFKTQNALLDIGALGKEGDIYVRDNSNKVRIHLDGNTGDIKLSGADCAEEFDVTESGGIEPGMVLVIDEESMLRPCEQPYDKKVAGVVSGGNGSNSGIILGKKKTQNRRMPIALNGKVHCKVDAQYSQIEVGDLLTTSPTPGHAMKADDPIKSFGAVIGKALCQMKEGKGLIPILVALQ